MRRLFLLACLVNLSCAADRSGFAGQTVTANAIGSSILAATSSGVSRASGGCWAACPAGTTCNPNSGLCEELPCRGMCNFDEHCELTPTSSHCVPGSAATIEIGIGRKAAEEPATTPAKSIQESASPAPARQP